MSDNEQRRRPPRAAEYIATAVEIAIVATSVVYVVTSSFAALIAWEPIASLYLVVGLLITRRRSIAGTAEDGRTGVLDTLSWVLPFAAGLVGINSAILFLLNRGSALPQDRAVLIAVSAAAGIVISWLLLHTGSAQMYQTFHARSPDPPGLAFPSQDTPQLVDYLYFAFTIGTSFATSDCSRKCPSTGARRPLLGHKSESRSTSVHRADCQRSAEHVTAASTPPWSSRSRILPRNAAIMTEPGGA